MTAASKAKKTADTVSRMRALKEKKKEEKRQAKDEHRADGMMPDILRRVRKCSKKGKHSLTVEHWANYPVVIAGCPGYGNKMIVTKKQRSSQAKLRAYKLLMNRLKGQGFRVTEETMGGNSTCIYFWHVSW